MADVLMVAVVRLPGGEEPFMRQALDDDALNMNSDRSPATVSFPVESVPDSDLETALRVLGIDPGPLVAD